MRHSLGMSLLILALSAGVSAKGKSKAKIDGRKAVVKAFAVCLSGKSCDPKQVFTGPGLKLWPNIGAALGKSKTKILRLELWPMVPRFARKREKLKTWLAANGFEVHRLARFTNGSAIENIKGNTGIAFVKFFYKAGKGEEWDATMLILRRDPNKRYTWRVCYWRDSPSGFRAHLLKHHKK